MKNDFTRKKNSSPLSKKNITNNYNLNLKIPSKLDAGDWKKVVFWCFEELLLISLMSALDGLSGSRHMEGTRQRSAAVYLFSTTSGRRVAPPSMLTKTPGIFIIHWLSSATTTLLELHISKHFWLWEWLFLKGGSFFYNI